MITIYGLREAGTDEIRYIGRTGKPLDQRLRKHVLNAEHGYPRRISAWIAEAGEIEIVPIAECAEAEACRTERAEVMRYHALGNRLTNGHLLPSSAGEG